MCYRFGGALYLEETDHIVDRELFVGNKASTAGGGVAAVSGCTLAVQSTQFTANTGVLGGAMFIAANTTIMQGFEQVTAADNFVEPGVGDGAVFFFEGPTSRSSLCHNCSIQNQTNTSGASYSSPPHSVGYLDGNGDYYAEPGIPIAKSRNGPVKLQLKSYFGTIINGTYLGNHVQCALPSSIPDTGGANIGVVGQTSLFTSRGEALFGSYGLVRAPVDAKVTLNVDCRWENRFISGVTERFNQTLEALVNVEQCYSGYRAVVEPGGRFVETCLLCPSGTFSLERGSTVCTKCEKGLKCPGGNATIVEKGYWESPLLMAARSALLATANNLNPGSSRRLKTRRRRGTKDSKSKNSTSIDEPSLYKCPNPSACPDQENGKFNCNQGYTGILCAVCEKGYYMVSQKQCVACGGLSFAAVLLLAIVGVAALGLLVGLVFKKKPQHSSEEEDAIETSPLVSQSTQPPRVMSTVAIMVPHGMEPGDRLTVQAEGQVFEAMIPDGTYAGDTFMFTPAEHWSESQEDASGASSSESFMLPISCSEESTERDRSRSLDSMLCPDDDDEEEEDGGDQKAAQKMAEEQAKECTRATDKLTGHVKLVVTHLQILGSLSTAIEIQWPSIMSDTKSFTSALDLDVSSMFALDCMKDSSHYEKMALTLALPILILSGMGVAYWIGLLFGKNLKEWLVPKAVMVIFLVYPGVGQSLFKMFLCKEVNGTWYLDADYRYECYDEQWMNYAWIALAGIFVFTIGVPLGTLAILTRSRHKLYMHGKFQERYGFLYTQYEPQYFWYEVAEMGRKAGLLCVAMVITPGSMTQICFCLLVVIIFIIMHIKLQPYEHNEDDNIQSGSLTSLYFTLCCAALIVAEESGAETPIIIGLVNGAALTYAFYIICWKTVPEVLEKYYPDSSDRPLLNVGETQETGIALYEEATCSVCHMHDSSSLNPIHTCNKCKRHVHWGCCTQDELAIFCPDCAKTAAQSFDEICSVVGTHTGMQQAREDLDTDKVPVSQVQDSGISHTEKYGLSQQDAEFLARDYVVSLDERPPSMGRTDLHSKDRSPSPSQECAPVQSVQPAQVKNTEQHPQVDEAEALRELEIRRDQEGMSAVEYRARKRQIMKAEHKTSADVSFGNQQKSQGGGQAVEQQTVPERDAIQAIQQRAREFDEPDMRYLESKHHEAPITPAVTVPQRARTKAEGRRLLKELRAQRDSGVITLEEYQAQKALLQKEVLRNQNEISSSTTTTADTTACAACEIVDI